MKQTSARTRARGSQIAELAIITPILMLLLLGMVDMAALYRTHQVLNNATREGARFAVLKENAGKTLAVRQIVVDYFNSRLNADSAQPALTIADVVVDQSQLVPTAGGVYLHSSRVTVTYNYNLLYLPRFYSNPAVLRLTTVAEFSNLEQGAVP